MKMALGACHVDGTKAQLCLGVDEAAVQTHMSIDTRMSG